jgi:hypothetical protein
VILYSQVRRIPAALQMTAPPSVNSTGAHSSIVISRASVFLAPRRLAGKGNQRRNTSCRGKLREGPPSSGLVRAHTLEAWIFVSDLKYLLQNLCLP